MLEPRDYRHFRIVPRTPVIGGWIEGCNLADLDEAERGVLASGRKRLRTFSPGWWMGWGRLRTAKTVTLTNN
mgnify:CR=1 FL=1